MNLHGECRLSSHCTKGRTGNCDPTDNKAIHGPCGNGQAAPLDTFHVQGGQGNCVPNMYRIYQTYILVGVQSLSRV